MHTFVTILQIVAAVGLIVLLAIQTSKAEQGGVMGLGAAGGRGAGEIDMLVGPERILKPLTKWLAGGFLCLSLLSATVNLTFVHFAVVGLLYLLVMIFGNRLWSAITGRP